MKAKKRLLLKSDRSKKKSVFQLEPPASLLRGATSLDQVQSSLTVTVGLNVTSSPDRVVRLSLSPAAVQSGFLTATTKPFLSTVLDWSVYLTSLNNFSPDVDIFYIRPKMDMVDDTKDLGVDTFINRVWEATGGATSTWAGGANPFFDMRGIPFIKSVFDIKYKGSFTLSPNRRVKVSGGRFYQNENRGRTFAMTLNNGAFSWCSRGEFFVWYRYRVPILSSTVSSGRAQNCVIVEQVFYQEVDWVANKVHTPTITNDNPVASGTDSVFKYGITPVAAAIGNVTI